jgi:predicted acyl esterase
MRDGIGLRADVLRPDGAGRFPVLVCRTPYGRISAHHHYTTFQRAVERGYAVVVQVAKQPLAVSHSPLDNSR